MIRSMVSSARRSWPFALLSLLSGCSAPAPPVAETPPPPVTVSQPVVREVTDHDEYEGRIAAAKRVEIRSRVRGHLMKVNFQDGQIVKAGDLLYEIDPRPYQAALDEAHAQATSADASLELAKAELKRVRTLTSKGAASREELEVTTATQATSAASLLKAKAAEERAKLDLEYTKITAPIGGRISRTQVDPGNLVNAGGGDTLLTTLVTDDPSYVYFNVDERALLKWRRDYDKSAKGKEPPDVKGMKIPVYVALEGDRGFPQQGVIDFADNRVNPSTGTVLLRGVLANPTHFLADGMRARVRVPVSDPHKALLITERAIGTDQARKFVYVVNAQNVVERRDVATDRSDGGMIAITEGLKPDDRVIVNGIQRVREGMAVVPKPVVSGQ